jgi:Sec-independent protein translocase protein TatA
MIGRGTREFRKGISEGASEEKSQEDRKEKNEEKPPLDEAAGDDMVQAETETTRAKQKA